MDNRTYRYYKGKTLYPFGYGLSYTNFEYSDLKINKLEENIEVFFKIKNIGNIEGKEIAQLYISEQNTNIFKAKKELKGFEKLS